MTEGPPKLYNQPEFASILAKVLLEYPDAEDPLKVARNKYEERALVRSLEEWETHARETEYYISLVHDAPRKGRPGLSSILDLGSLKMPL